MREGLKVKGRKRRTDLAAISEVGAGRARNDLVPKLELVDRDPNELAIPARNVRGVDAAQVRRVMHSINIAGFVDPVLIDPKNSLIEGVIRVLAAIELKLPTIPCVVASHLTALEKRALRLALNRLSEKGSWSLPDLKAELIELVDEGIHIADTAFTITEFDQITIGEDVDPIERGPLSPDHGVQPTSRLGDVFTIDGGHRVICGDATDPAVLAALMQGAEARFVLTDEPYNVPIAGHVTKGDHREFLMASGEMSDDEFLAFNKAWFAAVVGKLCDGGLIGTFIDWRGYPKVDAAALASGLTPINLIVWAKTNGGMGSLYRSQHELFPLYKKGAAPHVNNIELGKNGRWRSNVWNYPGASSIRSDSRKGLELHPTVKPEAICVDAILDLTNRDDIVLDPFLGSGSTLIAAQRTGRRCYGIELDPRYVDVVLNRYQEIYGRPAILVSTGETFENLIRRRQAEQ